MIAVPLLRLVGEAILQSVPTVGLASETCPALGEKLGEVMMNVSPWVRKCLHDRLNEERWPF